MNDAIKFSILDDGTIKIETGGISGANHVSADELLADLNGLMGGTVTIKQKTRSAHTHTHKKARRNA